MVSPPLPMTRPTMALGQATVAVCCAAGAGPAPGPAIPLPARGPSASRQLMPTRRSRGGLRRGLGAGRRGERCAAGRAAAPGGQWRLSHTKGRGGPKVLAGAAALGKPAWGAVTRHYFWKYGVMYWGGRASAPSSKLPGAFPAGRSRASAAPVVTPPGQPPPPASGRFDSQRTVTAVRTGGARVPGVWGAVTLGPAAAAALRASHMRPVGCPFDSFTPTHGSGVVPVTHAHSLVPGLACSCISQFLLSHALLLLRAVFPI